MRTEGHTDRHMTKVILSLRNLRTLLNTNIGVCLWLAFKMLEQCAIATYKMSCDVFYFILPRQRINLG